MTSKPDKLKEAIEKLNKQYGRGTVLAMDESAAAEPVDIISTGNAEIDKLTGIGGFPRSRIVEVFGSEAGGKTTLCLQTLVNAQKLGTCAYIDAENALDAKYAEALGVNVNKLLMCQPSNGEEGLEVALALIETHEIPMIVIDSVAALVPKSEIEGDFGDSQMGIMGRMMSQACRKLTKAVHDSNTCLVFINQIRSKFNVMFGSPTTTTGGKALLFYSSLRLEVTRISQIKQKEEIIGANTRIRTAKNKFAPPLREIEIPLHYGRGFINASKD